MSTSIADNPAVTNPHAALTVPQQAALGAICFFKHHWLRNGKWQIGTKRFSASIIHNLVEKELVRSRGHTLEPTTAGRLAYDKLKGQGRGVA